MITGRYQFVPNWRGTLILYVEDHVLGNYEWRKAKRADLKALEPAVADGWRFPEERWGILDFVTGRRHKD